MPQPVVEIPPEIHPSIQHIDGFTPDSEDQSDIEKTPCLNCGGAYDGSSSILFTRAISGRIWWHRHHCGHMPLGTNEDYDKED